MIVDSGSEELLSHTSRNPWDTKTVAELTEAIISRATIQTQQAIASNPLSDEDHIETEVRFRVLAEEIAKLQCKAGMVPGE